MTTSMAQLTLGETLVDQASIAQRVQELGREIDATYQDVDRPVVLLCILKGSILFTADLCRALTIPVEMDFIMVRSYGEDTQSSGTVELIKDAGTSLEDRDVLMVEDIVDTGLTTSFLYQHFERHAPRSLRLASLLNKEERRQKEVRLDFCGFTIPDRFVVGYGLDLAERWRNLPDVRVVKES